jgi:hypothetical protein
MYVVKKMMDMNMKSIRTGSVCAVRWLGAALVTFAVAACGGGGSGSGTPINGGGSGGGGTTEILGDLSVVLSRNSVSNNGTDNVDITVTSVDANRVAIGKVKVDFAIDNGGVISPAGTTTDAVTGILKATASIGADRTNRTVCVTVSSGTVSKVVSFDVVDSVSGGKVADLAMTSDRSSIANDGSQTIQVTITSLDAARSGLGGSPVSLRLVDTADAFVVANGGLTTTDPATGQLVATIRMGSVRTNRQITLTATSGTVSRSLSFSVVDPLVAVPRAADMTILLDKPTVNNTGTEAVNVTVTAVDDRRNVLANIPIAFTVDSNATIAVTNGQTNSSGQAKAVVQIGSDRSNRFVTVTARSDSLVRTVSFRVEGVTIQSTARPALPVPGSVDNKVDFAVTDANKNAMAGVAIVVTPSVVSTDPTLGPVVKTGTTGPDGVFTYTYTAPLLPGQITFTADAAGQTRRQEVTVPVGGALVPVATPVPSAPTLSASPNVVRANADGGRTNSTEIRALFLSSANAPVKNVRVKFDLNGDVNNIGGTLGSEGATVYTDESGYAVTTYYPAGRASPTNGVTVRACWDVSDVNPSTQCSFIGLTVVSEPLAVSIGTNESISAGAADLTYIKQFIVLAVDAAGNPKQDVQLTPSIDLTAFRKGYYSFNLGTSTWEPRYVDASTSPATVRSGYMPVSCANEDSNRNGAIDGLEDLNANTQLDPRKSDVSISMVGSSRTDASGLAIVRIEYPKSFATWIDFTIRVAAAGVLSPPAFYSGTLPAEAAAFKRETPPPAFQVSPYGVTFELDQTTTCRRKD